MIHVIGPVESGTSQSDAAFLSSSPTDWFPFTEFFQCASVGSRVYVRSQDVNSWPGCLALLSLLTSRLEAETTHSGIIPPVLFGRVGGGREREEGVRETGPCLFSCKNNLIFSVCETRGL